MTFIGIANPVKCSLHHRTMCESSFIHWSAGAMFVGYKMNTIHLSHIAKIVALQKKKLVNSDTVLVSWHNLVKAELQERLDEANVKHVHTIISFCAGRGVLLCSALIVLICNILYDYRTAVAYERD